MTPQHPDRRHDSARRSRAHRVSRAAGPVSAAAAWLVCAVATIVHLADKTPWPVSGLDADLPRTISGQVVGVALLAVRLVARALG